MVFCLLQSIVRRQASLAVFSQLCLETGVSGAIHLGVSRYSNCPKEVRHLLLSAVMHVSVSSRPAKANLSKQNFFCFMEMFLKRFFAC
jgi:hypothetical protein